MQFAGTRGNSNGVNRGHEFTVQPIGESFGAPLRLLRKSAAAEPSTRWSARFAAAQRRNLAQDRSGTASTGRGRRRAAPPRPAGVVAEAGHAAEDAHAAEAVHADGAGHAGLPGRRAVTAWFAVFTVYAGAEIFTRHADGTWGAWACGGYALATMLLLLTRSWVLPLGAAFIGAFLAPLTWMILKLPTTSTAEVVVINRSADYLAAHGTRYLPASLITD
jgi:hypothetical protein